MCRRIAGRSPVRIPCEGESEDEERAAGIYGEVVKLARGVVAAGCSAFLEE